MNRIKNFIAASLLIICLCTLNAYAVGTLGENETPFLPVFTEDKKDEALNDNKTDNSTDSSVNSGNISNGGGSSYTTDTKQNNDTEVSEELKETEITVKGFNDVSEDDWFYSDVIFAFNNKIMTGTGEIEFSPYTTLNRAMMITILHRIDGNNSVFEKNIFIDVEKNSWYENAVNWGYENKIVSGTSDTTFSPTDNLTREQLCVMLYNYTKHIGIKTEFADILSYSDNDKVSDWAKDAVCWAVQEKIVTGKGNNNLAPEDSATRAEAAAVIRRYIENIVETEKK